ncbi:MAG: hypothetical protein MMC33_003402 [Icmadophila ericetorum]|nr:hypothetical protein [Icmadophila ericetorum]
MLQSQGYATESVSLPSTGTISPGNPKMNDDIAAIRSIVEKLVEQEEEVLMVMHSAGGFLGSSAIDGLGIKARKDKGLSGGVYGLVFLSGAVFPEGFTHGPLPFMIVDGGAMHCAAPEKLLFNDLDESTAQNWIKTLKPQPAADWDDTITYCGWKDVPSVYLICEGDAVIPPPMQQQLAGLAGSKVETCASGHMPMLSMPEKVVEVIKGAAAAT